MQKPLHNEVAFYFLFFHWVLYFHSGEYKIHEIFTVLFLFFVIKYLYGSDFMKCIHSSEKEQEYLLLDCLLLSNKRIKVLENAVLNYSGGGEELERRVRTILFLHDELDEEIQIVLKDIVVYLRDIRKHVSV
ncbi:hypothetical protein [Serratia liquefaciens]|uniref:hypothetical protein n=1 Tax=Serratia liquefaciens TaxID=614 RepID=UPI003826CA65